MVAMNPHQSPQGSRPLPSALQRAIGQVLIVLSRVLVSLAILVAVTIAFRREYRQLHYVLGGLFAVALMSLVAFGAHWLGQRLRGPDGDRGDIDRDAAADQTSNHQP
jgi:hypothetical protein